MNIKPYVRIEQYFNGKLTAYKLRAAEEGDIQNARNEYNKTGVCPHTIIYDQASWIYDNRYCFICGESLGQV